MASCIVVASNRTAEDLETIDVVRRALDFPGPPQWYRPERPSGELILMCLIVSFSPVGSKDVVTFCLSYTLATLHVIIFGG